VIAPIGVRPANYQNGVSQHQMKNPSAASAFNFNPQQSSMELSGGAASAQFTSSNANTGAPPGQPSQQSVFPSTMQQLSTTDPASKQQQASASGNSGPFQSSWSTWGVDQTVPSNISDIFGQGRSFGPLGSDFGGNRASTNNGSGGPGFFS